MTGVVKTTTGVPIEGVMVIGSDLNYAETDSNGFFQLKNPDDALVFWCTGYKPQPQLIVEPAATGSPIEVVLNALG